MKTRIIFPALILSIVFSFIFLENITAQTPTVPKLNIEIPELVARVNGVDIESKYVEFRLNQILRKAPRPLTVKEKTSIAKDLIEKEVVRELVNQQGKKENLEIDNKIIKKELESLRSSYSSEEDFTKALKARNITLEDIKKSMQIDINARQLLNAQIKGKKLKPQLEKKGFYHTYYTFSAKFNGDKHGIRWEDFRKIYIETDNNDDIIIEIRLVLETEADVYSYLYNIFGPEKTTPLWTAYKENSNDNSVWMIWQTESISMQLDSKHLDGNKHNRIIGYTLSFEDRALTKKKDDEEKLEQEKRRQETINTQF